VKEVVDDNITEVVSSIVAAYDSGELQAMIDGDHDAWQKWIKGIGKTFKRKVTSFPFLKMQVPKLQICLTVLL